MIKFFLPLTDILSLSFLEIKVDIKNAMWNLVLVSSQHHIFSSIAFDQYVLYYKNNRKHVFHQTIKYS